MSRSSWMLTAAVVFILALVSTAPAALVSGFVARASNGRVSLLDPVGTVWSGTARLAVVNSAQVTGVSTLSWRLEIFKLLGSHAEAEVAFTADALTGQGRVGVGLTGYYLRDLAVTMEAQALSLFYPAATFLNPGGRLVLSVPHLSIRGDSVIGDAELTWHDASMNLSEVKPLGSYRLAVGGEGRLVSLGVTTQSGALVLTGTGTYDVSTGALSFNGEAAARSHGEALRPLLLTFGQAMGSDNVRRISLRKSLKAM